MRLRSQDAAIRSAEHEGSRLPDVLPPGLVLVFCGTAAGTASARAGAYYAGPGNAFWPTLHRVGLTPRLLAPQEFASLAELGIGLTDLCKQRHGSDLEVGLDGFDPGGLRVRITAAGPAHLAFNGKNAARGALGRSPTYGRSPDRFGGATTWVLPSTSGAARRFWDLGPWQELAAAVRATAADRGKAAERKTAAERETAAVRSNGTAS